MQHVKQCWGILKMFHKGQSRQFDVPVKFHNKFLLFIDKDYTSIRQKITITRKKLITAFFKEIVIVQHIVYRT